MALEDRVNYSDHLILVNDTLTIFHLLFRLVRQFILCYSNLSHKASKILLSTVSFEMFINYGIYCFLAFVQHTTIATEGWGYCLNFYRGEGTRE